MVGGCGWRFQVVELVVCGELRSDWQARDQTLSGVTRPLTRLHFNREGERKDFASGTPRGLAESGAVEPEGWFWGNMEGKGGGCGLGKDGGIGWNAEEETMPEPVGARQ